MYDILHSICWNLANDMNIDKQRLFVLVHMDTDCSYEDFVEAYNQVTEAYIK
jgi:hypothetical protein